MSQEKKYIKIFECCKLIKGFKRSLFVDIQRKSYRFFPNELVEFIERADGSTIENLKASFNNDFDEIIDQNLSMLEKEEFIFFTDIPELFPKMNLEWDSPADITNAIVDISKINRLLIESLWDQFCDLGCEHIQLRIIKDCTINDLAKILNNVGAKRIISIEIICPFEEIPSQEYINFVWKHPRISSLILHSAPYDAHFYKSPTSMGNVYFSTKLFDGHQHCGLVGSSFFNIEISALTESMHHNSCLNRKISIDVEGNIKNCPSMKESFGNIKNTHLAEAIEKPGFKKYWDISKDKILVCKDCEFRYICTDCRAYVEDPEDILSKPLKCGYNPYTGEWNEWSTNPLKQKAIDFYGMRHMVVENNSKHSE